MKVYLFIFGVSAIVLINVLSGCQEQQPEPVLFKDITLESTVVELVNASLDFSYNDTSKITKVEVQYLFHNIAGRTIDDLKITVEFLDKNGTIVAIGGPKYIRNLPKDYVEQTIMPANIISYTGENVYKIHHVKIVAVVD